MLTAQYFRLFNHFNHQNFFTSIWSVTFAKIFLRFDILTISPILNLGYLSLFSSLESIHVLDLHPKISI